MYKIILKFLFFNNKLVFIKMKTRIANDLHLDQNQITFDQVVPPHINDANSIFICSGDIAPMFSQEYKNALFSMSSRFKHSIIVFGNHEYYNATLYDIAPTYDLSNISILQRETILYENYHIIGCTLWTNYNNKNPSDMRIAMNCLNDYNRISKKQNAMIPIRASDVLQENEKDIDFIQNKLTFGQHQAITNNSIVITHHSPTFQSAVKHKDSKLNGSFCNNYDNFIQNKSPLFWIHGHSHEFVDYMIHNTRIINNPYGYTHEKTGYEPYFFIDVSSVRTTHSL